MTPARILVVDDEPDVEALITQKFRRQVRKGEMDFLFAHDGLHALEILDGEPDIDMVLSDINMPRMDGLTLLDRLNERHGHLKTVIVSAFGDMGNIRTAMNRGAFDFALSGEAALELLKGQTPPGVGLVLSDINMPGMSGIELLAEIRETWPELGVFMITAYGDNATEAKARDLGAERFLTKPVDFAVLKDDLSRTLEGGA